MGGAYLCFQINEGKEAFTATKGAMFIKSDDPDRGLGMRIAIGLKWLQVYQYLEKADVSDVRLSLVGSFREARPNNIRFVPIE